MTTEAHYTPATADIPLRVVVFERAADGSPGYREFRGRRVSESPDSILYKRVDANGDDLPGLEYVERGDVLAEEPLETGAES